jgi:hypothetical protein
MADWKQVRRIALGLPETSEQRKHGHPAWCVRDVSFAWERPLRASDILALGKNAPKGPILAVRVEHLLAKEARLAAAQKTCFTTPHFDGYPSVLVRLDKIAVAELSDLIVEAWLARAPRTLARQYLDERSGRPGRRKR